MYVFTFFIHSLERNFDTQIERWPVNFCVYSWVFSDLLSQPSSAESTKQIRVLFHPKLILIWGRLKKCFMNGLLKIYKNSLFSLRICNCTGILSQNSMANLLSVLFCKNGKNDVSFALFFVQNTGVFSRFFLFREMFHVRDVHWTLNELS